MRFRPAAQEMGGMAVEISPGEYPRRHWHHYFTIVRGIGRYCGPNRARP